MNFYKIIVIVCTFLFFTICEEETIFIKGKIENYPIVTQDNKGCFTGIQFPDNFCIFNSSFKPKCLGGWSIFNDVTENFICGVSNSTIMRSLPTVLDFILNADDSKCECTLSVPQNYYLHGFNLSISVTIKVSDGKPPGISGFTCNCKVDAILSQSQLTEYDTFEQNFYISFDNNSKVTGWMLLIGYIGMAICAFLICACCLFFCFGALFYKIKNYCCEKCAEKNYAKQPLIKKNKHCI